MSLDLGELTTQAHQLVAAGDLVGARALLDPVLATVDPNPASASAELAEAAGLHARVLIALDEPEAARPWAALAYSATTRLHGSDDERTIGTGATLAAVLHRVGSHARSIHLYRGVITELTAIDGPESQRVLAAHADLATVEHARGECASARERLRNAWEMHREVYGDAHPAGLKMLARLGAMERDCRRHTAAEELLTLATHLCRTQLAAGHPLTDQVVALTRGEADPTHVCGGGPTSRPFVPAQPTARRRSSPSGPRPAGEPDSGPGNDAPPTTSTEPGPTVAGPDVTAETADPVTAAATGPATSEAASPAVSGDATAVSGNASHATRQDLPAPEGVGPAAETRPHTARDAAGADEVCEGTIVTNLPTQGSHPASGTDGPSSRTWAGVRRVRVVPPDPGNQAPAADDAPPRGFGRRPLPNAVGVLAVLLLGVAVVAAIALVAAIGVPAESGRPATRVASDQPTAGAEADRPTSGGQAATPGSAARNPAATPAARATPGTGAATPGMGGVTSGTGTAPTGLTLADTRDAVALTWRYPSGAEGPVVVSGGRAGQDLRAFEQLPAGTTRYVVYGLNPNLDYCFSVAVVYGTDQISRTGTVCTDRAGST